MNQENAPTLLEGIPEILAMSVEDLSGIDPLRTNIDEIINRTKLLENDLKVRYHLIARSPNQK